MKNFKVSIIIPFYNEEAMIDLCLATIIPMLEQINQKYEIICIDDGSQDNTYEILENWSKKNKNIIVLKLTRNFGKEAALTAGFDHVTGDCIIPLDADLQDPPSELPRMIKTWQKGYDVVLMKRITRDDSFLKKLFANFFYNKIAKICRIPIESNVGDFRLLDKKVVKIINLLQEKNRFCKGLFSWPGFKTITLEFNRPKRQKGTQKQSFTNCLSLALDAIFSFSVIPIRLFTLFGIFLALASAIFGFWIIYQKLFVGIKNEGYASLITAIIFLNSTIMIGIGILGEYIGRIYKEVKNRPIYVIEKQTKG
jgi:glycosyltransferase involved in cell wall biosynthesis